MHKKILEKKRRPWTYLMFLHYIIFINENKNTFKQIGSFIIMLIIVYSH
jgi:hypothetical protein